MAPAPPSYCEPERSGPNLASLPTQTLQCFRPSDHAGPQDQKGDQCHGSQLTYWQFEWFTLEGEPKKLPPPHSSRPFEANWETVLLVTKTKHMSKNKGGPR